LNGSLTPFIHKAFNNDVQSIILDGEMCAFSKKDKILVSKGTGFDVKTTLEENDPDVQICFCVFDILMYNNNVLTNKPLINRIDYLNEAFTEIDGRIFRSKRQLANTNFEVMTALNKAIDDRLEGIVVKDPNSIYKPSVRSGSGWYKVKPDYMLGLNDDLDLLIVGAYYGEGRRSGLLSHFLLAVALENKQPVKETEIKSNQADQLVLDDDEENNTEKEVPISKPETFYTFCKVGSGYTYKELKEFNDKLSTKWKTFDKKNPPKHLEFTSEKPSVWIEPKDSLIVQIKAVEISETDRYKTKLTLRFPRLERFRPDKPWYECMTFDELKKLNDKYEGKLAGKHFNLNDYDEDGNLKVAGEIQIYYLKNFLVLVKIIIFKR
jgi:DNA ligase 4